MIDIDCYTCKNRVIESNGVVYCSLTNRIVLYWFGIPTEYFEGCKDN